MAEKGVRFLRHKEQAICHELLHSWRVRTQEVQIDELSIFLNVLGKESIRRVLMMYFVKWRSKVTQLQRLERMMQLQENSRLVDLRLLAFFFDHWVIGKYNSVIESSISSRHAALSAGVRLVHKVAGHRLIRRMMRCWLMWISRADHCGNEWAKLALLIGKGSSISGAIAGEASMFLLKSRHESQTWDESLEDANSRMMYLTLTPMQNKGFLASEISDIREMLTRTRLRIGSMENKLALVEGKM